jgi:hypothetical protein
VVEFEDLPLNMLLLKNEESQLIEVMEVHGKAKAKGIKVGDIVVEMNGKRLEFGMHHDEFASLVSKSSFPIRFSLWRSSPGKRFIDTVVGWNGGNVAIVDKNPSGTSNITTPPNTIVTVTEPRNLVMENNGIIFSAEIVYASRSLTSFLPGDLLIGFMHVPLSPNMDGKGLIEMLKLHHGPEMYLNIWRPLAHGRPHVPKVVSPVKSPLKKKMKHGFKESSHRTASSSSSSNKQSSKTGLENLAAEAPLSLSSMMSMMGSMGTYGSDVIGSIATTTVEVLASGGAGGGSDAREEDDDDEDDDDDDNDNEDDENMRKSSMGVLSFRRMHYSDVKLSDILYTHASEKTPWIFEQSVWCGGVECEWHTDDIEEGGSEEPPSPAPSNISDDDWSPRRRTSSFHALSPKPVKRHSRSEGGGSGKHDHHIIDVIVLITETSIYFIHHIVVEPGFHRYQLALKLSPDMLLDIALPYYTVVVNGDEVL